MSILNSIVESVTSSFTTILEETGNSWIRVDSDTSNYSNYNYNFNTHDLEVLSSIIQGTSTVTIIMILMDIIHRS